MDKFLENFFKTQRMHEWRDGHTEQWAQLAELIGNGTVDTSKLNEKQRKWVKYLERTIPGDENSPFVRDTAGWPKVKAYPTAADLKDPKDWERLYQICQEAWYEMRHNPDYLGYDMAVKQFIAKYAYLFDDIGSGVKIAPTDIENSINAIIDLLDKIANKNELRALGINDFTKLKKDVADKKYNTSKEAREQIKKIADVFDNPSDSQKQLLNKILQGVPGYKGKELDQYVLDNGIGNIRYDENWNEPDFSAKITVFQNDFPGFFKNIYTDQKVFDAFKSKEPAPNSITNAIEKAKKDIDYDDKESQNFIQGKAEEELTLVEQIQKWAGDTYEDYLKKYEGFSGGKKVGHPSEIATIIKIIDKEKIKPTDGLEKIIEKADDLYKKINLKNKQAGERFKWFTDALKDFNNNPNMAPNMKGTLKSGAKMRRVVEQFIIRATESGKEEDIKSAEMAMDLLTIIQYGNTTSRTLDILKEDKDLFNIFSNKDLSWNKNDGVKFVTGAMDKTLSTAFFMIGRGAAFAYNKYRMRNKKFTDENISDELVQARKNILDKNTAGRTEAEKNAKDPELIKQRDDANKAQESAILYFTSKGYVGTNDDIVKAAEADISNYKSTERLQQGTVNRYTQLLEQLETAKNIYKKLETPRKKKATVLADKTLTMEERISKIFPIESEISELEKQLLDIGNNGELDLTVVGLGIINLSDTTKYKSSLDIEKFITHIEKYVPYTTAQKKLEQTQNKIYERQSQIDIYREATENFKYADELIKEREKIFNEWDKKHTDVALHLEQYWNALQAPGMTKIGLFSKRVENGQRSIADTIARMGSGLSY